MLKRIVPLLVAAPLAACASFDRLDQGLATLEGQNRDVAIARLGYPTEQKEIAGKDVFIWRRGNMFYQPGTYFGGCSDRYGGLRSMSCVGFMPGVTDTRCTVRVIADKDGTIVETDRDGDPSSCGYYADRLQAGVPITAPDAPLKTRAD
jgi:hypothetical protein